MKHTLIKTKLVWCWNPHLRIHKNQSESPKQHEVTNHQGSNMHIWECRPAATQSRTPLGKQCWAAYPHWNTVGICGPSVSNKENPSPSRKLGSYWLTTEVFSDLALKNCFQMTLTNPPSLKCITYSLCAVSDFWWINRMKARVGAVATYWGLRLMFPYSCTQREATFVCPLLKDLNRNYLLKRSTAGCLA